VQSKAADPRPAGGSLVGVPPDSLRLIRFRSHLVGLLRLVRAALDQPDRGRDEEQELEELRLPVFHHRGAEL
jgi:hypothetical protein